ncbi:coatomer subunit delta-like [Gossypium australe]|uniref:Coatomer subunit delta n=1 Tax=Gossypium australe TaxID=47621 RepID=A0A5B6VAS2_9ROSI|nr:coatomer subunit delta-like [Gossypium australe]
MRGEEGNLPEDGGWRMEDGMSKQREAGRLGKSLTIFGLRLLVTPKLVFLLKYKSSYGFSSRTRPRSQRTDLQREEYTHKYKQIRSRFSDKVVLAASVLSKSGKVLVSRQFVDMTRIRIEGLLAAFPKLVGTGKQHTYVETENVRYVYQPIEALYLLLVTNKQSNILEDLETLRLLSKLVPEYCYSLDEEGICKTAFELIFAFDEVICLGHKENVTVAQVKQYCEMESHEEKLHKLVLQSKINETKDVMKRKASEIDKSKVYVLQCSWPYTN